MKLSVVIPVYNEVESLDPLAQAVETGSPATGIGSGRPGRCTSWNEPAANGA